MKKLVLFLILTLLLSAAVSCAGQPEETAKNDTTAAITETVTETDTERTTETEPQIKEAPNMQLIPDLKFETGMRLLTQKDHKAGDSFKTFKKHSFYGTSAKNAKWRLAQWDSGPDLSECIIESNDDTITDGKWRTFSYNAEENMMTFRLDTSAYYNGSPAKYGDYWPHLLIEQDDFGVRDMTKKQKAFYSCGSKSIILSMDIRLGDYSITPIDGDWVRAAQFLLYFYVKGVSSNDFCWFGVQLFDNRSDMNDNYIGYDGGKADASGAMIYSIGSRYIYRDKSLWEYAKPKPDGDWVHIEIDIRPFLDDMLEKGLADGYFKVRSLDQLCINGMNMGWETIGTFDHTMYVKNFSLTSYPEGR